MKSNPKRRRRNKSPAKSPEAALPPAAKPEELAPVPWAVIWLVAAFVLPNLWTLTGSFLYDDLPIIVQNDRLHSLHRLGEIWTHGYWPDRPGLTLYRPVTQTIWAVLWTCGSGKPLLFHALNLVLGGIVVWQVYLLLVRLRVGFSTSFFAAALFAVLPIHTEVTAAIVGSNELAGCRLPGWARCSVICAVRLSCRCCFICSRFSRRKARRPLPASPSCFLFLERSKSPPFVGLRLRRS